MAMMMTNRGYNWESGARKSLFKSVRKQWSNGLTDVEECVKNWVLDCERRGVLAPTLKDAILEHESYLGDLSSMKRRFQPDEIKDLERAIRAVLPRYQKRSEFWEDAAEVFARGPKALYNAYLRFIRNSGGVSIKDIPSLSEQQEALKPTPLRLQTKTFFDKDIDEIQDVSEIASAIGVLNEQLDNFYHIVEELDGYKKILVKRLSEKLNLGLTGGIKNDGSDGPQV